MLFMAVEEYSTEQFMLHGSYGYPTNPFELVDVGGYCGACMENGAMAMEDGSILIIIIWVLLFIRAEIILASDGLTQLQMIAMTIVMIVVPILALVAWKMELKLHLKRIFPTNSCKLSYAT